MSELKKIKMNENWGGESVATFLNSSAWHVNKGDVAFRFSNFHYPVEHVHKDFCEIYCVLSGEIVNIVNGEKVLMKQGDCCLILKDDKHLLVFLEKKPKDCLFVNFIIKWDYFLHLKYLLGETALSVFETPETKYFHLNDEERIKLLNRAYFLQTPNDEFEMEAEFDCKCIIIDLLKSLAREKQVIKEKQNLPDWLKILLKNMKSISNMHRSLEEIVAEIPYSYSYIVKEFKKYLDCSMINYFASIKLRYARELIFNTDKTILDISMMVGYNSLSHFNRIFKKEYGLSPSQLRNQRNIVEESGSVKRKE